MSEEQNKFILRTEFKTLRDEFAMAALTGIVGLGLGGWSAVGADIEDNRKRNSAVMAELAYSLADAMLSERVKEVK